MPPGSIRSLPVGAWFYLEGFSLLNSETDSVAQAFQAPQMIKLASGTMHTLEDCVPTHFSRNMSTRYSTLKAIALEEKVLGR
jgi:hypothetical protein